MTTAGPQYPLYRERPPTPDPDEAEAADRVLWSLDLASMYKGAPPQPVCAHRIVSFERDARGVILAANTVCGQRHLEGFRGCWQLRKGELPLARPWVHCGWDDEAERMAREERQS